MADKIAKLLAKLPPKQLIVIKLAVAQILSGNYSDLDIKMIKGQKEVFRVRVGNYRIIFKVIDKKQRIVAIDRRNERTYKNL